MATKSGRPVSTGEKTKATRVAGRQPSTVKTPVVGADNIKKTMKDANVSVANTHSNVYKGTKTDGIKIRGTGAATKGVTARGPMA